MPPLRILWLKTGPLHPLDTGGKLRTYHTLRELAKTCHITFLALCPPDTSEEFKRQASEYSHRHIWVLWESAVKGSARFYGELAGNLLSPLPYVIRKYRSLEMAAEIEEEDHPQKHDLIVCDFLTPAINLFQKPPGRARPQCKTLLFQHNVEAQIWERLHQQQTNLLKRWYFRLQWRRLKEFERAASVQFDSVVAVSEGDAKTFRQEYGLKNVLGSVPTGVDVEFFAKPHGHPQPGNVAFLGSMDWMPNIDAVNWFVDEIFPLLKQRVPSATFTIIGRNPPESIQALAKRDPAIRVTGTVPDTRPHLAKAEVMVVPLRVGGGTRIKIYEAMAAGLPVVSTRIGAEGLPVAHGENILLADTPADFAAQTAELLAGRELRERLGSQARALVREKFGWASVTNVFAEYCRAVTEKH